MLANLQPVNLNMYLLEEEKEEDNLYHLSIK